MQDYIPQEKDINDHLDTVTVKQFDNNSRFLHVKFKDVDLTDVDDNSFDLADCTTALYIKPESDEDDENVNFVNGTIESAESGIVTFLLPGGVTQNVGRYECEIWIYQGDETNRPVISTKPFTLVVEKSIKNDSAIEATPDYSALTATMTNYQALKNQMAALVASPAGSGGDVGTEVRDARVGFNGTEYDSLGEAVRTQMENAFNGSALYIDADRFSSMFSGNFDNVPNNRMYPIEVNFGTAEATSAANSPEISIKGTLLTFGRKLTRFNLDIQIYIPQNREKMYMRNYSGTWSDWTTLTDRLPQYRADVNDSFAEKNYLLSNITDEGTFYASRTAMVNGETIIRWTDRPRDDMNFIITNQRYSEKWMLQTAVSTNTTGIVYNRLIPRLSSAGSPRDWVCISNFDSRKKVLAVGDSIARGWRNGGKGYTGLLGLTDNNVSESGATLSTRRADITNIPTQIDNITGYQPDIIIADGGINDYILNVPMGVIPTEPTTSINSLNLATVMGGLEKLFYLMITKYPNAHRYFVITHKTFHNDYYVTVQNTAGYTQQDLHDAIVACCKVYNVEVIDIYERGFINTLFESYRSQTHYTYTEEDNWATAKSNTTDYVDSDGIHPLNRGYNECYVPLIREAIKDAMP